MKGTRQLVALIPDPPVLQLSGKTSVFYFGQCGAGNRKIQKQEIKPQPDSGVK
jgi:hypothetical protein